MADLSRYAARALLRCAGNSMLWVAAWRLRRKLGVDATRLKDLSVPADAITPLDFAVVAVSDAR